MPPILVTLYFAAMPRPKKEQPTPTKPGDFRPSRPIRKSTGRITKKTAAQRKREREQAQAEGFTHYKPKKRTGTSSKGKPKGELNEKIVTPDNRVGKGPICGANRSGRSSAGPGICCRPAGWGTDHVGYGHCRWHGGNTPGQVKAAEKEAALVAAREATAIFGLPIDRDPHEALLDLVHKTSGHVEWLANFISDLDTPSKLTQMTEMGVEIYQTERKMLSDFAKAAIAAGVAERKVFLAEQQGRLFASVIQMFLLDDQMKFTPEQAAFAPKAMRRALEAVPTSFDPATVAKETKKELAMLKDLAKTEVDDEVIDV
jgi:hypothetical protein